MPRVFDLGAGFKKTTHDTSDRQTGTHYMQIR